MIVSWIVFRIKSAKPWRYYINMVTSIQQLCYVLVGWTLCNMKGLIRRWSTHPGLCCSICYRYVTRWTDEIWFKRYEVHCKSSKCHFWHDSYFRLDFRLHWKSKLSFSDGVKEWWDLLQSRTKQNPGYIVPANIYIAARNSEAHFRNHINSNWKVLVHLPMINFRTMMGLCDMGYTKLPQRSWIFVVSNQDHLNGHNWEMWSPRNWYITAVIWWTKYMEVSNNDWMFTMGSFAWYIWLQKL